MRKSASALGITMIVWTVLTACAPAAPGGSTSAAPTPAAAQPAATQAPAPKPAAPAASQVPAPKAAGSAATQAPAPKAAPAAAQPSFDEKAVADFYRGKTVKIVVGFTPGGAYDTFSRAIAQHIGRHLPGNPTFIVENMPGAGSLVATNHTYNVAPKDGTVIAHFSGGLIPQQLFGSKGVEFDATKFLYLGAPMGDTAVLHVSKAANVTRPEQFLGPDGKELALGGTAPGSMNVDDAMMLRSVLGAKVKVVQGYPGGAEVRLAIERGELDGFFNAWEATKTNGIEQVQAGNWINVLQMTDLPHRELPDVPTIATIAKSEEQRQLLHFGQAVPGRFARPFVVPPGVPAARVQALREALAQTLTDKDFLTDAAKAKLTVDPLTGDQLQQLIQDYLSMPSDLKGKLQKILAPGA